MGNLVLNGSTSGQITVSPAAVSGTNTITLPAITDTMVGLAATQTLTNKTLTSPTMSGAVVSTMASSVITSQTSVASTSGTSITFTSIPSWVKRITVMLSGVSTSSTSRVLVQLGVVGVVPVTATGYLGAVVQTQDAGTPTGFNFSTGFCTDGAANATAVRYGQIVMTLLTGNTWVESGVIGRSDAATTSTSGGSIALSGTLDRVVITTINGTDTFDAGTINILYE